ncbi:flagellar protein FlaG [Lachnospiraceae bacterium 47-T17]
MTMEPIQNAAAAYQGSASTVEKKVTPKAPEKVKVKSAEAPAAAAKPAADETSGAGAQTDKISAPEKASDSSLKKAVEEINRQSSNTEAIFGYHEGTNRVTIKIMDKDTKEIKKEYPAEKTLDMIQKVWEMAGLMVDEKL